MPSQPADLGFDIGADIWARKYRFQGRTGVPADATVEDTWARVARAAASNERSPKRWAKVFTELLADYRFLPGGRIIANAGTCRQQVTMLNCYVMNRIEDSIEGIFDTVKDAALTQKQGGGVGFDFSTIRPTGCHISGCEAEASGPLSFMQVLDATCRTIMSAGQRRGAQMGVLRCDHPDIEKFITIKRSNAALQMFNLSVAVTDKFIAAVRDNREWELVFNGQVYKTIHAVDLWELIMKSTYNFAEPGFLLVDRINAMNNLWYAETISATNPCGEQPLPPYGACLLGSVNLTRFVKAPFSRQAAVDFSGLATTVGHAVRFLDNILDLSGYPLPQQRAEAEAKRRMGLGITGLADLFLFLGLRYGSPESASLAGRIMATVRDAAYEASISLGREKGVFPAYDPVKYNRGQFIRNLPASLRRDLRQHGLRNSHLTSIAPTGTISLFAGNISSGLEPVFAWQFRRKIRNGGDDTAGGGSVTEVDITDYAYRLYLAHAKRKNLPTNDLPAYFVTASEVTPAEHITIQAALQPFVDSSISKTINVPADYPYEDFKNIYLSAYDQGLKGCTTFRPSEHITGVLTAIPAATTAATPTTAVSLTTVAANTSVATLIDLAPRPKELDGTTYKLRTPLSSEALYLTINDVIESDGRRRPYELFINTKNLQHFSWIVAMTRLISAVFRREPDPSFLVEELKSIYDPNGGYFANGRYVPSLVADIGLTIEQHLCKIGLLQPAPSKPPHAAEATVTESNGNRQSQLMICPQCSGKGLMIAENCLKCVLCDYSKCG